jgi:hypothetical protein
MWERPRRELLAASSKMGKFCTIEGRPVTIEFRGCKGLLQNRWSKRLISAMELVLVLLQNAVVKLRCRMDRKLKCASWIVPVSSKNSCGALIKLE